MTQAVFVVGDGRGPGGGGGRGGAQFRTYNRRVTGAADNCTRCPVRRCCARGSRPAWVSRAGEADPWRRCASSHDAITLHECWYDVRADDGAACSSHAAMGSRPASRAAVAGARVTSEHRFEDSCGRCSVDVSSSDSVATARQSRIRVRCCRLADRRRRAPAVRARIARCDRPHQGELEERVAYGVAAKRRRHPTPRSALETARGPHGAAMSASHRRTACGRCKPRLAFQQSPRKAGVA
jgi:hypothetical protein